MSRSGNDLQTAVGKLYDIVYGYVFYNIRGVRVGFAVQVSGPPFDVVFV